MKYLDWIVYTLHALSISLFVVLWIFSEVTTANMLVAAAQVATLHFYHWYSTRLRLKKLWFYTWRNDIERNL